MINGAHVIVYSKKPRWPIASSSRRVGLQGVDAGGGWLIFRLPPAELAVHPSEKNDLHELYFTCENVESLVAALSARNVTCGPIQDQGWGRLTQVTLPGGGKLGIYEPRHAQPS